MSCGMEYLVGVVLLAISRAADNISSIPVAPSFDDVLLEMEVMTSLIVDEIDNFSPHDPQAAPPLPLPLPENISVNRLLVPLFLKGFSSTCSCCCCSPDDGSISISFAEDTEA